MVFKLKLVWIVEQVYNGHGSRLRQMKVHVYMDWGLGFVDYGLALIMDQGPGYRFIVIRVSRFR